MYGSEDACKERQEEIDLDVADTKANAENMEKFKEVLTQFRIPLIIAVSSNAFAQLTGGIVIRNYAPEIFEDAGMSTALALMLNLVLGIIKLVTVILSASYVSTLLYCV